MTRRRTGGHTRGPVKPKRDTRRKRVAPQWGPEEWREADVQLRRRAGGRCECCLATLGSAGQGIERHHRARRRDGGDRLANLLLLNSGCHRHWTEHPEEARARGVIVSAFQAQRVYAAPVLHHGQDWVVLDDDGRTTPLPGEPDSQAAP